MQTSKLEAAYNDFITPYEIQMRNWGLNIDLTTTRNDDGAISIPWAAATAAGVGLVVVITAILVTKANSQANNIPDTIVVPGGG